MKHKCYSFENSGHRFVPLDGAGGVVYRLYCQSCSRVVPASEVNNVSGWDFDSLPPDAKVDFMTNPLLIRKES